MNQNIGAQVNSEEVCLECGSSKLKEEFKEQKFPYGPASARTILTASIPVLTCQDCGYEFFDERGESARHDAVCKHIGVQTPNEIREVRESAGLGRVEFCKIGGFGIASLQRWEAGEVIQNASSDRLIYLLRYEDNIIRLKERDCARTSQTADVAAALPAPMYFTERSNREFPNTQSRRTRSSAISHFPTLERMGELTRCQHAAERIQRRGCVLTPMV